MSRLNSCSSKYRFSPSPIHRTRNHRANQLELVVAIAVASISSVRARLPSKDSWRTTRAGSWAGASTGMAAARSTTSATAATPLTEAPGPGDEGVEAAKARLTTCSKPGSLTTLRLHVNVRLPTGPAIRLLRRPLLTSLLLAAAACAVGERQRA